MRLFIAIPLQTALTSELSAIARQLQAEEDGLRWSAAESYHVTLQFLGTAGEEQYQCLVERLKQLRSPQVRIRTVALGFFDRAGVFFAAVDALPGLKSLQQAVSEATSWCGFVPEERPYHPHITLGRSKAKGRARPRPIEALRKKVGGLRNLSTFLADEFVLYESVTAPGGSLYQVRERFPLEAAE